MKTPYRAMLPVPLPPSHILTRQRSHPLDTLEVVFSTSGDLVRVRSDETLCSASWNHARTKAYLECDWGSDLTVPITPQERTWLDDLGDLVGAWQTAVESADRIWVELVAKRIEQFDDRSDGLLDLRVVRPARDGDRYAGRCWLAGLEGG